MKISPLVPSELLEAVLGQTAKVGIQARKVQDHEVAPLVARPESLDPFRGRKCGSSWGDPVPDNGAGQIVVLGQVVPVDVGGDTSSEEVLRVTGEDGSWVTVIDGVVPGQQDELWYEGWGVMHDGSEVLAKV